MQKRIFISFGLLVCWFCSLIAQVQQDIIYKEIGSVKLKMTLYTPEQMLTSDTLPVIIFFFGGGWETGNISQFQYYAQNYVKKGLITVLAEYRISSIHGTTPFESLKDAKSAVRYLKQYAEELQIDTTRLIASGGSAGGHLAAACFTNETINENTDPMEFTSKPTVLILFNPVVDNSINGYGYDRLGDRWEEFSPIENIRSPFPPTIFFLGTKDNFIPVSTGQKFKWKIENVGGRCDLKLYEGAKHGFFNKIEYRDQVILDVDVFLQSVNCLVQDTSIIIFP
ncbi:MAG: alpha/beta hydrolase [Proteiniphilum sp.]